jgi:hypothetical protein
MWNAGGMTASEEDMVTEMMLRENCEGMPQGVCEENTACGTKK